MPDFTITIDDDYKAAIIQKVAIETGRTAREMIEQHINNWAEGQIEGYFINKIKDKTTAELIDLLGEIE